MTTGQKAPRAPAMVTYDTIVLESIVETWDTRTLVLDLGREFHYRAGQYVSIAPQQFIGIQSFCKYLEHVKGRVEAPRAYSMCSAPDEPHVAITIKEEVYEPGQTKYPPLLSGYLVHGVKAGDRIAARGFAGAYVLPDDIEARTDHILHLCAGSGSVPNFSMAKDSLRRHRRLRHTFVYSNKTWDDVIFRDALGQLQREHPERFRVVHSLTRQTAPLEPQENVRKGRVDVDLLGSILTAEPHSIVFACGPAVTVWEQRACKAQGTTPPPRFLESMLAHLATLGMPSDRIKLEAFG